MPKPSSRYIRRRARQSGTEALSVTTLLCAAGSLAAGTRPEPEKKKSPADLKEVLIEGNLYNPKRLLSPKFTEPVRDLPQTVTIIPKQLIEDRGAFSLRDVLKNTPGISMQAVKASAAPIMSFLGLAAPQH